MLVEPDRPSAGLYLVLQGVLLVTTLHDEYERGPGQVVGEVEALHLATADKRPSESDLVGVLKVAADRQPTREPSHADSSA